MQTINKSMGPKNQRVEKQITVSFQQSLILENNLKACGIPISEFHQDVYRTLQKWIDWNVKQNKSPGTIRAYFGQLKKQLWFAGIKLDAESIRYLIKFPRAEQQLIIPITKKDIAKLLAVSKLEFRYQILLLVSSGMRIGELSKLKVENLRNINSKNIMAVIPASITKTRKARLTFFSKQVSNMIRYRIQHNTDPFQNINENITGKRFSAARQRANLLTKFSTSIANRYEIHLHGLRKYFVSSLNGHFAIGHILAGHDYYMSQYNQYTPEQLLNFYRKDESKLIFSGVSKIAL